LELEATSIGLEKGDDVRVRAPDLPLPGVRRVLEDSERDMDAYKE